MARSYQENQDYLNALSRFGKDLARRSGSACEICSASGVALSVFEVPPGEDPPMYESCVFLCDTCRGQIETPRQRDAQHWRCLTSSVWSEVPAIQVLSVLMLRVFAETENWASEVVADLYLEPEVEALLETARLP